MAKSARAGELRTLITVMAPAPDEAGSVYDKDGFPCARRHNPFGEGKRIHCKWVNAYGSEVYEAKRAGVEEPATLTMRYTGKITPTCEIFRGDDPSPYEVISVNDVEDRHIWLEVKVCRKVAAK